ncbi:hypothetical protein V6M85_07440 [Sulfolobus tengchongensis]|uniref:Uncharacterized protein n=1 Tax=Sulfolobus tengchongensis TaxID=207809 RepID=A0AAX4KWQ8_9CREN
MKIPFGQSKSIEERLLKEIKGESENKSISQLGNILFPDYILAFDLTKSSKNCLENKQEKEVTKNEQDIFMNTSLIEQWKDKYNFYMIEIAVGIESVNDELKGVEEIHINLEFNNNNEIQIIDSFPTTQWESRNYNADINVGLDLNNLKFIPFLDAGIKFTYKWEPKIGAIIANAVGRSIIYTFRALNNEYLDGVRKIFIIFLAPKDLKETSLICNNLKIVYTKKIPIPNTSMTEDSCKDRPGIKIDVKLSSNK